MTVLRGLFDWMHSQVEAAAIRYAMLALPDPDARDQDPFVPYDSYLRIWVAESYLAKSRHLGTGQIPTVHAAVSLRYAGNRDADFAAITSPGDGADSPGSRTDFALTELLPYSGGLVEIEAGLVPLRGDNVIVSGIKLLGDLGKLVAPPISAALDIAGTVASGVGTFLQSAEPTVTLGFHRTYSSDGGGGANVLVPGYVAVLDAESVTFPPGSLSTVRGTLCHGGRPLEGVDYLLLRIEKRQYRDDWRFPNVMASRSAAIRARGAGDTAGYRVHKGMALDTLLTSEDLTPIDQIRASLSLTREFDQIESGGQGAAPALRAAPGGKGDLGPIIETFGPSPQELSSTPRPRLGDLLGSG